MDYTHTSLTTLCKCPRKYQYAYEYRLRRRKKSGALSLGAAFHTGLDVLAKTKSPVSALNALTACYDTKPSWAEPKEWEVEQATAYGLFYGYCWRYQDDPIGVVASELTFGVDLNASDRLRGKIDAIMRLPDGRLVVGEYKTAGEDISRDSDYWPRLRVDPQIQIYYAAAVAMGYEVAPVVLYDVTRKPTIKLRKHETPEEYRIRLIEDIQARPDYYYARREIELLRDGGSSFRNDLSGKVWLANELRQRRQWPRFLGWMTCHGCEFQPLCFNNVTVNPDAPPQGYEVLDVAHPELEVSDA